MTNPYLKWLSKTATCWWNDSAELAGMEQAIENGATGVTTNPILVKRSLFAEPGSWRPYMRGAIGLKGDEKVEEIIRSVTVEIAKKFETVYKATDRAQGYVCAQVNPNLQGDAEKMLKMGKRLAAWAPNVAVKVPATAAGAEAIEELSALGVATVGTVSFTVSQAVEIARRQHMGAKRAKSAGRKPGAAFSVIMVGRLDDYLRDVARDMRLCIPERDIIQAGTACFKRAYAICKERGYGSKLMPAAMRGVYHASALAGADITMSIAANIQALLAKETDYTERISEPVPKDTIERLLAIPEFARAYGPDGMKPSDFITFGATQRTLAQFIEAGWAGVAEFEM